MSQSRLRRILSKAISGSALAAARLVWIGSISAGSAVVVVQAGLWLRTATWSNFTVLEIMNAACLESPAFAWKGIQLIFDNIVALPAVIAAPISGALFANLIFRPANALSQAIASAR